MSSLYTFKEEDAFKFAKEVGAKTRRSGNELTFQECPYCHSQKDKYKFSISLLTGQFECKRASCGIKGNMITLSKDFNFSLGREVDTYYQSLDYARKNFRDFRKWQKEHEIKVRDEAIEYLKGRGISEEICRKYEITSRIDKDRNHILVFPFKDQEGTLQFIKYRNTAPKENQSKEFCEENCRPILFGMNHCSNRETLIITEGQIDSLSVAEAGLENAVSVPNGKNGFTWVPYCFDFVSEFKSIIVFGDCEKGQITLADEISKRWEFRVKIVRPEDYKGCKDANEILQKFGKAAVKEAVKNALAPNQHGIIKLATVKFVDILSMELFKSRMSYLDQVLDGGFRFGQLAVLTGKRGQGKSTLGSMFACEALDQGYNCFFYSGELPNHVFRNWLDRQITRKSKILPSDEDKLNRWYGERAFLYDSSNFEEATEKKDILMAVEYSIIANNCKFILVDNLMTALDSDDTNMDVYQKQSQFVGKLAKLSKKYNVFILLIAHPRKNKGEITNDDVAGSSNITDRADLVLSYGKAEKSDDEFERMLEVKKNRLSGKLAEKDKAIRLFYDQDSKRVAINHECIRERIYGWDSDPYGFSLVPEDMQDPFSDNMIGGDS